MVGKILGVLEELDRFVFDKNDPNSNCLDALATRMWGPLNTPGHGLTSEVMELGRVSTSRASESRPHI